MNRLAVVSIDFCFQHWLLVSCRQHLLAFKADKAACQLHRGKAFSAQERTYQKVLIAFSHQSTMR